MKENSVAKHTPPPWKAEPEGIRLSTGVRIPLDEDNAAFIVRAINAYDGLVAEVQHWKEDHERLSKLVVRLMDEARELKANGAQRGAQAEGTL